jgi:hypothetical protein
MPGQCGGRPTGITPARSCPASAGPVPVGLAGRMTLARPGTERPGVVPTTYGH